jgi:hypothetical protein
MLAVEDDPGESDVSIPYSSLVSDQQMYFTEFLQKEGIDFHVKSDTARSNLKYVSYKFAKNILLFILEQATRAQKGSRGIALPFLSRRR